MRAQLEASARRGNRDAIAALAAPAYPRAFAYLFTWYGELARFRGVGVNGELPLSWTDLSAWATLTGRTVTPWELRMLAHLDDAHFAARPSRG